MIFHWNNFYIERNCERGWERETGLENQEWRVQRSEQAIPLSWALVWLCAIFVPAFGVSTVAGWLS